MIADQEMACTFAMIHTRNCNDKAKFTRSQMMQEKIKEIPEAAIEQLLKKE